MKQTLSADDRLSELMEQNAAIQEALNQATKSALLEHARMGRSVFEGRDGRIVEVAPAEIFARYGLDEFGRPIPQA